MSNPQTFYTIGGLDLSSIFQPISYGSSIGYDTGYKVNGNDLQNIFASLGSTSPIGYDTEYAVNNNDFRNIFAAYNSSLYTVISSTNAIDTSYNNNGYTGLVFEVNNINSIASTVIQFNRDISNATVIIVGAAGGGGWNSGGGQEVEELPY